MKEKYPLQQLVRIKERRLEEAERVLKEKKEVLVRAEENLAAVERERDKTRSHRDKKVDQLREELDRGTTSAKIEMMRDYIKVVAEELAKREQKVQEQKKEVDKAKKAVESARKEMLKKQQDVEKLILHKKEWDQEIKANRMHEEGLENDELGTAMHTSKKRKR